MNIKDFYLFGSSFSRELVSVSNDSLDFETYGRVLKGQYEGLTFPIFFIQESGKKWNDVINAGSVGLYLLSQRFIELLKNNNISGWKSFDVVIKSKNGEEITNYFGLSIIGKGGKIDYSRSSVIEKRIVPNGLMVKYYKGMFFRQEEWSSSDFFIPEDTLHIIISKKVQRLIEENKITNAVIQNITEYEIPEYAVLDK